MPITSSTFAKACRVPVAVLGTQVNDLAVPPILEDPVPRVPGAEMMNPASPRGIWQPKSLSPNEYPAKEPGKKKARVLCIYCLPFQTSAKKRERPTPVLGLQSMTRQYQPCWMAQSQAYLGAKMPESWRVFKGPDKKKTCKKNITPSPRDAVNDSPVPVILEDPVPRITGGRSDRVPPAPRVPAG